MTTLSEDTLRAAVVVALYREFDQPNLTPSDALCQEGVLSSLAAPTQPDAARRVIHEMAADNDVPLRRCVGGKCVEFSIRDTDDLRAWVEWFVTTHDDSLLPL